MATSELIQIDEQLRIVDVAPSIWDFQFVLTFGNGACGEPLFSIRGEPALLARFAEMVTHGVTQGMEAAGYPPLDDV